MTQTEAFVGIDVSKGWLDAALWPTGETFRVTNDREGRTALIRRLLRLSTTAIGLEASGLSGLDREAEGARTPYFALF